MAFPLTSFFVSIRCEERGDGMDIRISSVWSLTSEAMEAAGCERSSIVQCGKHFRYLEGSCEGGIYDEAAAVKWIRASKPDGTPYCANVVGARKRVVGIIERYCAAGGIDLSMRSRSPPRPMPESTALLDALAEYDRGNHALGPAKGTCGYYWRLAREHPLYLERSGVRSPDAAGPDSILGFVPDILSRWSGTDGRHLASSFRPFLKHLGRRDLIDALKLAAPPKRHGTAPMLDDADEGAVALACCNRLVPARDAAITLLALTTGMRACDIADLKLEGIGWRAATAAVIQQKTGNPLTVPLAPALLEALAEHVLERRPDSEFPDVFVRTKAPHVPYRDHAAIYAATARTLRAAGAEGGGTLPTRHNAASRMLGAGAAPPVISAVLGHSDPDGTDVYMEAGERDMAACVPPLPKAVAA